MTSMQSDRFVVAMTPVPTAARVMRQRSALRMRVISALVSFAILFAFMHFFNPGWGTGAKVWIYSVWGATTVAWLVFSGIGLTSAKRDLAAITQGDAVVIDRQGITFCHPQPTSIPWASVEAVRIAGNNFGAGPSLVVMSDGQVAGKVPMSFIDADASTLESAIVAHSLGRARLDVSDMDRLI